MLTEFVLLVPRTLPEALEILAQRAPDVTPVVGGTNVIVNLRDWCHPYEVLMGVSRLHELREIRSQDGSTVVNGGYGQVVRAIEVVAGKIGGER